MSTTEVTSKFKFIRPIEAPVFTPTEEEFKDPLAYLNKIRPHAEKAGICKIRPPPNWQPPFAVDVDNFKFTPRVQRLNELEAKTRIKLNFLDRIAKFWELQGTSLKIPLIDKKPLDLYHLHELVLEDGGRDKINTEKKWNAIALRLGYDKSRNLGSTLKAHYEKFLYPFDIFESSKSKLIQDSQSPKASPVKAPTPKKVPPSMKMNSGGRMGGKVKTPVLVDDRTLTVSCPNELKRLAFYGAGPKMAGFNSKSSQNLQLRMAQHQQQQQQLLDENVNVKRKSGSSHDPLSKYMCRICGRGDSEDYMLLCDGCDDSYHTFCLEPPLTEIPKGEWRCPKCVADEVSKPSEAFGFEQAAQEYTLQQFGEMADQFKSEYFNMPVHLVSSEYIETEFWRIVSAIDEDVTVEYGADLHTMDHGSGFPTEGSPNKWSAADEKYIKSGWNLNNLPILPGSVLGHINTDISGMMVPWMYVGMCFATFCWHNEDHWSYSINYLHWGEPKTWYGVPGSRADDFEEAMKRNAPELFHSQPDLLHQLVTIMNPNTLMGAGVPVYRMDQKAGEFIVTFPRAYHAGFNQGYNFAEAVNFAPADWLAMGRACVEHYSILHRYCVFSHDELVCKMTTKANELDLMISISTYKDLLKMYEAEKEYRRVVLSWGVTECERVAFELIPDDAKLCDFCKTTCFLSAITCVCSKDRLVCLKHHDKLCECAPRYHTLKFRYTLDEIPVMMTRLKERSDEYEAWANTLREGITILSQNKMDLEELNELLAEAATKQFPLTAIHEAALKAKNRADKCAEVARKLASPAVRTRNRNMEDAKFKVTIEDLLLFGNEIDQLPVNIPEANAVRQLIEGVKGFQARATHLLSLEAPSIDDLKECLQKGVGIDIELPELHMLSISLERRKWLEQVGSSLSDDEGSRTVWTLEFLNRTIENGQRLVKHREVEECLLTLKNIKATMGRWEDRATTLLHAEEKVEANLILQLYTDSKKIRMHLPSLPGVRDLVRKTNDWLAKTKAFQVQDEYLFQDELELLIRKGEQLPIVLNELKYLKMHGQEAREFKVKVAKMFLRRRSTISLVAAFIPRTEINCIARREKKRKFNPDLTISREEYAELLSLTPESIKDTPTLIKALNVKQNEEIEKMKHVRNVNAAKRVSEKEEERYCVCHSRWESGIMIQCHLCFEYFHATCVPLPKNLVPATETISSLAMAVYQISTRNLRFLCPGCCRTRRPTLDCLLDLLKVLQKIVVRIPEGEGIEFLTQRAMGWVDRAREFMHREVITAAMQFIEPVGVLYVKDIPERFKDAYKKTGSGDHIAVWHPGSGATITSDVVDRKKIIDGVKGIKLWNEQLKEFIGKPSLDPRNCTVDPNSKDRPRAISQLEVLDISKYQSPLTSPTARRLPYSPSTTLATPLRSPTPHRMSTPSPSGNRSPTLLETANALITLCEPPRTPESKPTPAELCVPSTSRAGIGNPPECSTYNALVEHGYWKMKTTPDSKKRRKSLLLNRDAGEEAVLRGPRINLSKELIAELDALLMEADLMEVTIVETEKLYRLREFTKPAEPVLDISIIQEALELEIAFKDLKEKRSSEEEVETETVRVPSPEFPNKETLVLPKKELKRRRKSGDSRGTPAKRTSKRKKADESEGTCASPKCIKPTGKIDWVQCEYGCDQWFHFVCVGLKRDDVEKIGRYCCTMCIVNKNQIDHPALDDEDDIFSSRLESDVVVKLEATSYHQ